MHTPLIHTPMMHMFRKIIGMAVLLALTAALVTGCKRPDEIANEHAVKHVLKIQEDLHDSARTLAHIQRAHIYYGNRDTYLIEHPGEEASKWPAIFQDNPKDPNPFPPQTKFPDFAEALRQARGKGGAAADAIASLGLDLNKVGNDDLDVALLEVIEALTKKPDVATTAAKAIFGPRDVDVLAVVQKAPAGAKPEDLRKYIQQFIDTAEATALYGVEKKAEKDLQAQVSDLEKEAAKTAGTAPGMISAPVLANAKMAAGSAICILADLRLTQIEDKELRIEHLLNRMRVLSTLVQANNVAVSDLKLRAPTAVRDTLGKTITAVTTGTQGVWIPRDDAKKQEPIPAQEAADKQIADLTKQIADLTTHRDDMQNQIVAKNAKAGDLDRESEKFSGLGADSGPVAHKAALDKGYLLYTQAAALRRVASDLDTQVKNTEAQIAAAQRQLAVVTAQKGKLDAAITAFKAQDTKFSNGWDEVQKQIAAVTAETQALVGGPATGAAGAVPAPAPRSGSEAATIVSVNDQIVQLNADLEVLRAEVKGYLDKADHFDKAKNDKSDKPAETHAGYFADAVEQNKNIKADFGKFVSNPNLKESATRKAWQFMIDIHGDFDPFLQQALVQQRVARLYADKRYSSANQKAVYEQLPDVLEKAQVTLPPSLESKELLEKAKKFKDDSEDAKNAAEKAFVDCEACLDKILPKETNRDATKPDPDPLVQAAFVTEMIEQYGHSAFAASVSDGKAGTYLTKATDLALDLTKKNVTLPLPLPPEIAPPPGVGVPAGSGATAGPGPATGPTTAPDATPTTGPATAPAPDATPAAPAPPAAPATPPAPDATPPAPAPATPPATTPPPVAPPATPPAAPPATAPAAPPAPGAMNWQKSTPGPVAAAFVQHHGTAGE